MAKRLIVLLLLVGLAVPVLEGVSAFGHGKPGTKKYCRHHKKRCKKNVRSLDGRLKVRFNGWGVGAGWKPGKSNAAVTDDKVYFDVILQTGEEPVVNYSSESGGDLDYSCPNDGGNEYWVCNGKTVIQAREGIPADGEPHLRKSLQRSPLSDVTQNRVEMAQGPDQIRIGG